MRYGQMICWGAFAFLAATAGMGMVAAAVAIPLEILEPAERTEAVKDFPASLGLIFPEGELTSTPGGAVVDDQGNPIPFDWEVTGWWSPEKTSVKWLLLHFKASSDRKYSFVLGADPARPQGRPLAVESRGAIEINTGPLRARLGRGNAPVFESVSLNGRPILAPGASFFEMVDDEGRALGCEDWTLTLEENTPLRAVVKAEGLMSLPGEPPLAKLSVRYQFFAGEGFVRFFHTFIWMEKSLDPGANRIGLRFRPEVGERGVVRVGLSDYTDDATQAAFGPDVDLVAYQDDAERYAILQDSRQIGEGKHLGGWISVEGEDGRGVGVSLKNAWQTYPTTLAVRKGDIEIGLWPEEAGRFSFEERDIMPDGFYFSDYWKEPDWTREGGPTWFNTKDVIPERARDFFGKLKAQAAAAGDSPGKRIASFLRPELQARLRSLTPDTPITDGFRARIAHGMNAFLEKSDFYDAASWRNVELKPKARELLGKGVANLDWPETVWFNRLLIESAFPEYLTQSDVPHFIHEYSPFGKWGGPQFLHTGEGAARTHELTILFYDPASERTSVQMNSLTQHPFIMRQSPEYAMRVPFFGFQLSAVNREKYPDIERAVDHWGCSVLARFPEAFDYGFLRFGMQRNAGPLENLYRYTAGMQYDQQIIPWLLYLRGGDRKYYEEAMNTAAYAMDIHTNHHNTRGVPPGYGSFTAAMPLPHSATHGAFNMRVHFLSACYHATGYRRAQEVMMTAIEGAREAHRANPRWGRNRELFAINMFLAHACDETFDPFILDMLREASRQTLANNYDPETNLFASPAAYLFDGLIPMYEILKDPGLREVMLTYLHRDGAPGLSGGGVAEMAPLSAYGWAYEQTANRGFARLHYDQARICADLAPEHDWNSPDPVSYPAGGNQAYGHRILPLLTAMGTMEKHSLNFPEPPRMHDLFVSLTQEGSTRTAYVKARKDGDLRLELTASPQQTAAVEVKVFRGMRPDAPPVASAAEAPPEERATLAAPRGSASAVTGVAGERTLTLTIPRAAAGEMFRVEFGGGDAQTGVKVLSDDAQIVHEVKPGFVRYSGNSWQYYRGTRLIVRTKDETLTVRRSNRSGAYTLRDAETGEVLARSGLQDPVPRQHRVGKGRFIEIVMTAGRDFLWSLEGVEPYVSARLEDWFSPE